MILNTFCFAECENDIVLISLKRKLTSVFLWFHFIQTNYTEVLYGYWICFKTHQQLKKKVKGINETKMEECWWLLKLGYGYIKLPYTRLSILMSSEDFSIIKSREKKKNHNTCSKSSVKLALSSSRPSLSRSHVMSRYTNPQSSNEIHS